MIKPAFIDPETATDPETWKIAGDIEGRAFDNEQLKFTKGEQPNEDVMYAALYDTWSPYITADSLSRFPDKKGKIKNDYREDITSIMRINYPSFANGGVYYNQKKDYKRAADFFERYWNMPSLKMFTELPVERQFNTTNDTTFQIVKCYAAICAIQGGEHERAIKFLTRILNEPYLENGEYKKSELYELLATEYIEIGDSAKYIGVLEDGAKLYPTSKYFMPNLINEMIRLEKMDEALAYLDQAIAGDPANSCELYSVKASIYAQESKFDDSFVSYEKALAADENCERALDGLAVAYIMKGQELKGSAAQATSRKEQSEIDAQANELYKKAYPLLERLRTLLEKRKAEGIEPIPTSREIKQVLYKLRNAYYNLDMNAEYEAISKIYDEMGE
jgi:tetratricopeptide (TPR) repeat protein